MKIADRLASLVVPITSVHEDPENVRGHPVRNMDAIKRSLERFGQRKPIVVRDGIVVAGNGTLRAALALGATHIAAVSADDLTEAEARAYGIMDNKSSDLAEWDYEDLGNAFRNMDDELRTATGFADFEIEPLLKAVWTPPEQNDAGTSMHSVQFTDEEYLVILQAVEKVTNGDKEMKRGRAVYLICEAWLVQQAQVT